MKRHFVEPRDLLEARHVVGKRRMIGAQHGAEVTHALGAFLQAGLVEVVAEQIDAVGARQIVEGIAIEIGQRDPGRRLPERSRAQVLAHQPAELEGHAIRRCELQIRDAFLDFGRQLPRLGEMLLIELGQTYETGAPTAGNLVRSIVGAEELRLVELVEGDQRGQPARHARVAGQRPVLGLRQLQTRPELGQRGTKAHGAEPVQRVCRVERVHSLPTYASQRDAA
jgi:hypothetical protein